MPALIDSDLDPCRDAPPSDAQKAKCCPRPFGRDGRDRISVSIHFEA